MTTAHTDRARAVYDSIAADTRRTNGPMLRRMVLTIAPPFIVFLLAGFVSSFVRGYFNAQFADEGLNTLTFVSTTLLTLALVWWTWKYCERRFGGLRAMRLMFEVLRGMNALETGLKAAQDGEALPLDDAASDTWSAWERLLAHLGLPQPDRP